MRVSVLVSLGVIVAMGAVPAYAAAADWPQFHFDVAHTGVSPDEASLSPANVSGLTESWSASLGPGGESSPAVIGGVVYVGSDDGGLYAIDAVTGTQVWRAATGGSISLSSPAVAGGRVFVGSTDQKVHAFDQTTGAELWATTTGTTVEAPPTVVGGVVYAASDKLYALDAATGSTIWSADTGGPVGFSAPTVVDGKVYVGAFNTSNLSGMLEAFDAATGTRLWTTFTGGAIGGAPVVVGGRIFVGVTSFGVKAFDAASGAQIWWNITTGEGITTPAVLDGRVYLGDQAGNMYALDAGTGAVVWKTNIRTRAESFEFSSPALANGVLYIGGIDSVGTGGEAWAFDAATGGILFSRLVPGSIIASPAVVDGRVYFVSDKLRMFSLPSADTTPPEISVPGDITVNATSPAGAAVSYSVTAGDPDDEVASLGCVPASASTFAIGTTTVDCTASDTHGNTGSASFMVHVKGAAEQLADLRVAVTGVGPGTSLADKVIQAQTALNKHDLAGACSTLNALINQLKALSGKSVPAGVVDALVADATRIRAVLGC